MEEWKRRYIIKEDFNLTQGPAGPQGPPGADGGAGTLPLSTDDVDYRGDVLTDVLDALLYLPLSISSFSAPQTTFEKGQTLTSIQLSWTFNKAVESQTITGTDVVTPTLTLAERTKLVTLSNITSNRTITLTADDVLADANAAKTSNLNLTFLNKIYYGKSVVGTVNSAFVLALTGELKSNRTKSFSLTTGASEYIWFASPVAYGLPSFKTNGFNGGFDLNTTLTGGTIFVNASGHAESYYVFRSTNENLGLTAVDVL